MRAWLAFVLRHRALVVGVVLAITALAGWSLSHAVIASSLDDLFLAQAPGYESYQARAAQFGSDELLVVAYETDAPLDPALLDRLRRVTEDVAALDDVGRVHSVLDAVFVDWDDGTARLAAYADRAPEDPDGTWSERLSADPRAAGLVVGTDGRHGAVTITLAVDPDRPAERGALIVGEILAAFAAHGFATEDLHLAGHLALMASMMEETIAYLVTLVPLSAVAVALAVFGLFRRLLPVLVASGLSGLAAFWAMGLAIALDPQISIFLGVVPVVVMVVAVSDVVHLWSAAQLELARTGDKEQAILDSGAEVGPACLLTSATTFAGFLVLCLIPVPLYQQLGVVLAFGVAGALWLAVTLMPVVLSLVELPRVPKPVPGVDGALDGLLRLSTRSARAVLVVTALVMAVCAFGVSRYRIDLDLVARMPQDSQTVADTAWFAEHFSGTNLVEVYVETPESGGALDPGLLRSVAAFQDQAEDSEGVDRVLSLVDALEPFVAPGTGTRLPDTRAGIEQALFVLELGGRPLDGLVDEERQALRLLARVPTTSARETEELRQDLEDRARRTLGPEVRVEAAGMTARYGAFIDQILVGEVKGLGVGLVVITVLMILGLRSVRVGLLSMLPNLLPVLVILGVTGWVAQPADVDTVVVALIALGIGVDDTIHMLVRLRHEGRSAPPDRALARAFGVAGRAIVYTTVILVLGFVPMGLGQYATVKTLGTLLPLALLVALAADLLVVPALVTVGWLRFPTGASGG